MLLVNLLDMEYRIVLEDNWRIHVHMRRRSLQENRMALFFILRFAYTSYTKYPF